MTYSAASSAIGRDVTGSARYILLRARKAAEENTGSLFEVVRSVGVKRLPPNETAGVGVNTLRSIRRKARVGMTRLGRVRGNMPQEEQAKITAYRSQLGAIAVAADGGATKRIEAAVTDSSVVPAGRVLDLLK